VVRLTPSRRAIAISLDGNGRRTWLDPRLGGMSAVCEAARNVACTGARPAAVTNCLNFANPEHAEVGYELAEAVGVVGVLEHAELAVRAAFREEGDVVLLAGAGASALDGSDYQKVILGETT